MKKIFIVILGIIPLLLVAQKVERKIIGSGDTLRIGAGRSGISSTVRGGINSAVTDTNLVINFESGVNGNVIGTNLIHLFTTGLTNLSTAGAFQVQSNGLTVTGAVTMTISTAQSTSGSRSLQIDASVDNVQILATLKSSNSVMSYGMAVRLDAGWLGLTFGSYNIADLHSQDGNEFTTINLFDGSSPNIEWATQTGTGLSSPIQQLAVNAIDTWFWITVKWDGVAGLSTIRMYNYIGSGSLGTEITGSPKTSTFISTPKYPNAMLFGRPDNHDVFNPGAFWFIDDIVLKWDGTFPVLPP